MRPAAASVLPLAWLLASSVSAPGQAVLLSVSGELGEPFFGSAVSDAGDVDLDGHRDFVVGDPFAGDLSEGRVQVRSGTTGAVLLAWSGQTPGEEFGAAVAGGVDVDGDARPDIVIGAPLASDNGAGSGAAWLLSGADGDVLFAWTGSEADSHLGASVAFAGDVNEDGFVDVVLGAPREGTQTRGAARVHSGRDGTLLRLYVGTGSEDAFGTSVANAGDVDADGRVDLLVGAPQNAMSPGYVRVLRGDDGTLLHQIASDSPNDAAGTSVAGPGDVNGDGFDDLLAGVPGFDLLLPDVGAAVVWSGKTGSVLNFHAGLLPMDAYGHAVSAAGDIDGNGLPDVAAATDSPFGGVVNVHAVLSGQTLLTLLPLGEGGTEPLSGLALAPAGDADGDGQPDLVVGVPRRIISPLPGSVLLVSTLSAEWDDLGGGLPGAEGEPQLRAAGVLASDASFSLQLTRAAPRAPTTFVVGLRAAGLPFKGGQLVPFPDLVLPGFQTDERGGIFVQAPLLEGVLPGTLLVFQAWMLDRGGPFGFSASNGVSSVAQ